MGDEAAIARHFVAVSTNARDVSSLVARAARQDSAGDMQRVPDGARAQPLRPALHRLQPAAFARGRIAALGDVEPRTIRHPSAATDKCSNSAVLPIPFSPQRISTRFSPASTPATKRSSTSHSRTRLSNPTRGRWLSSMATPRSLRATGLVGQPSDGQRRPVGQRALRSRPRNLLGCSPVVLPCRKRRRGGNVRPWAA